MTEDYRIEARPSVWPADLRDLLAEVETATIGHFEHLGFVGLSGAPGLSLKGDWQRNHRRGARPRRGS